MGYQHHCIAMEVNPTVLILRPILLSLFQLCSVFPTTLTLMGSLVL